MMTGRLVLLLAILGLSGCAYVKVPLNPPLLPVEERVVSGEGKAKIAVIDLDGILTLTPLGLDRFSKEPPMLARFKEELRTAQRDPDLVGLVVRVDSPGGSVTASDILYHELAAFADEKGVPVVGCVMDKALSGGYYVLLGTREIVVHPTSLVGGIGVITFHVDISVLLAKWGIDVDTVQSGPLKDFWSPLRQPRADEQDLMQEIVDGLHQRFTGLVEQHRGLSGEALEQASSGRLFSAASAIRLGLADHIGYLDDAVARVRDLAGVDRARVIIYRRPGKFAENIFAGHPLAPDLSALQGVTDQLLSPSFRYQYLP